MNTQTLADLKHLTLKPFFLDDAALQWVQDTFSQMKTSTKLAQLLMPLVVPPSPQVLHEWLELEINNVFLMTGLPPELLRLLTTTMQQNSKIPALVAGDLEFSELGTIGGEWGTALPNLMGVAATGQVRSAEQTARLAAREGRYCGFNWSFTPVLDLNLNFQSAIVNSRAFGEDPQKVTGFGQAYIQAMQEEGMAACAKHWPGDGVDDRDQHLVTSVNSLSLDAWNSSFGNLYRSMVDLGVLTVMGGHISFPAYQQGRAGERSAAGHFLPATLSKALNVDLLREELGFNGVITSDASMMAGFTSHGERRITVPQCIENGCDLLLFPGDVKTELGYLRDAVEDGRLSMRRVDEAVLRILALKAHLGLHLSRDLPGEDQMQSLYHTEQHQGWAREIAEGSVTLVRDLQGLLPLQPQTHRRVLVIQDPERKDSLLSPLKPLEVQGLLQQAGFEVTVYDVNTRVSREDFDVLIYLLADEGAMLKDTLRIPWAALHGNRLRAMERHWHTLPTVVVSFGNPYHLFEVPECQTYVNAYSPVLPVQQAVVLALTGQVPFRGVSPVQLPE
ncbi:glycoside hydrolase family 3 protein [Deinococcus roseus]|uniref:beta-N-acetylhexosaminidase n=1 Tax=Deinococcus roseus TaxID=392414 RepID=A0ABQ2DHZ5_9DEIO|nr:glycoside hydrolase family 3 N-terminal domain-containing protein [Deinococcus roseus]GGJ56026.1 glycoside hydrolase family 3 [Deinococcus roseus]